MRIIVTDEVSSDGLSLLSQDPRIEMEIMTGLTKKQLLEILPEFDAIITRSGTNVDKEVLDAGKKLKIVARAGVGIDNVDVGIMPAARG